MNGKGQSGSAHELKFSGSANQKGKTSKTGVPRGSYKCTLCGKPKVNHQCNALLDPTIMDAFTQTVKRVKDIRKPGDKEIVVRYKHS